MNPKISIVTVSYNQAPYLRETIKSIISQEYPSLEYIIIDGGSTDGSIEIIKEYEKYITYWVSEKDNGVCDAINKGFKVSTGELMACINSDDMLHKKSLFTVAEIFENFKQVNWLLGASTIYDELGRTVYVNQSKRFSKYHFHLKEYDWIQLESTFWRRSLWEQAGGYFEPNLKYASDFDLWMRFFRHDKLYITDALIGGFRVRKSNQLSVDNVEKYIEEVEKILARETLNPKERALINLALREKNKKVSLFQKIKRKLFPSTHYTTQIKRLHSTNSPPKISFHLKKQQYIIE